MLYCWGCRIKQPFCMLIPFFPICNLHPKRISQRFIFEGKTISFLYLPNAFFLMFYCRSSADSPFSFPLLVFVPCSDSPVSQSKKPIFEAKIIAAQGKLYRCDEPRSSVDSVLSHWWDEVHRQTSCKALNFNKFRINYARQFSMGAFNPRL